MVQKSRTMALMTALIAATAASSPAWAWIDPDTDPVAGVPSRAYFEPEGQVSTGGRRVTVHGHAMCGPAGGELQVSVSILQQETLASIRGFSDKIACVIGSNDFTAAIAVPDARPSFAPGPVQVCALAQTRLPDGALDYDMWCVFVTLGVDPAL